MAKNPKGFKELITIEDAPVFRGYVDSLRSLGATVYKTSRWANAVSVSADSSTLAGLRKADFVSNIKEVLRGSTASVESHSPVFLPPFSPADFPKPGIQASATECGKDTVVLHYGPSAWQLERINVRPLHEMGLDATGVKLAFFDTGFRWREIEAERSRHVVNEYDFAFHDSLTANEANDIPDQDGHGTGTLGTAAGYQLDSLVGPAYNASLYLAKTEDERSETPIEEDNYAAAVEWAEAQGVQVYSCSLGYIFFDSGFTSYTYADLNGKTTISARATQRAVKLGMLPVIAMGNSGDKPYPYLTTPADADSILGVGALDVNDTIAFFSSRGPTIDGRIKPDIVAPGVWVLAPNTIGSYIRAGGTSYATPLVSGSAALIMQAHPEASAQAVRQAIIATGDRTSNPDTAYGHGKLNAYAAALQLGTIITTPKLWIDTVVHLCLGMAANNVITSASVRYRVRGETAERVAPLVPAMDSNIYSAEFIPLPMGTHVDYWIEAIDGADTITRLPRIQSETLNFTIGQGQLSARAVLSDQAIETFGPNPARDYVSMQLNLKRAATLSLYDVMGREVVREHLAAGHERVRFSISHLPVGSYLVRLSDESGSQLAVRHLSILR